MTSDTQNLKLKLESLVSTFTDLEEQLAPLFAQSLPETLVNLEPIQQAKLQTVLAYVVYDLIFIYLKTKGLDPKSHPVISELERIKQYFNKIQNAENPPKRTTEVDKAAASRFIKHAISEAQQDRTNTPQTLWKKTPAEGSQESSSENDEVMKLSESSGKPQRHKIPPRITSKMVARQQYEKELCEQDENAGTEDEDLLEVFDQNLDEEPMEVDEAPPSPKNHRVKDKTRGTRKRSANIPSSISIPPSKRRRPAMDPFEASGFVGNDEGGEQKTEHIPSNISKPSTSGSEAKQSSSRSGLSSQTADKSKKKKRGKKKNASS